MREILVSAIRLLVVVFAVAVFTQIRKRRKEISIDTTKPQKFKKMSDEELAQATQIDVNIISEFRAAIGAKLRVAEIEQEYKGTVYTQALISEPVEDALNVQKRLLEELAPKGYGVYVANYNEKAPLYLIRSQDDYDILRIMETNGANYDIETDDIIAKLEEWKQRSSFRIAGAAMDWVMVDFDTMPADTDAFAEEIYAFCPDSVDQGAETVEALAELLREYSTVFLWWD